MAALSGGVSASTLLRARSVSPRRVVLGVAAVALSLGLTAWGASPASGQDDTPETIIPLPDPQGPVSDQNLCLAEPGPESTPTPGGGWSCTPSVGDPSTAAFEPSRIPSDDDEGGTHPLIVAVVVAGTVAELVVWRRSRRS